MGQAASITLSNKSDILYDIDDFHGRFHKATLTTISVPMIIVAFPILNAYKFSATEYTGVKVVDSTIGGLLGVVGCKLYNSIFFLVILSLHIDNRANISFCCILVCLSRHVYRKSQQVITSI